MAVPDVRGLGDRRQAKVTAYEWISIFLEFAVLIVLLLEYLWGRPDVVIKNEAKQKKRLREKYVFTELNQGEHK